MGLMEITGTDFAAWNLRCNHEDRHAAAMTVEEPIDEVKVAGTATPCADGQLASDGRIGAGRERRHFLVADVDPFDGLLPADLVGYPIKLSTPK
jgi:hypothetical protein